MRGLKRLKVWQLVLLLILVIGASTGLIVGVSMVGGDGKMVVLDTYRCEGEACKFEDINEEKYGELAASGESFVVFIDQEGCSAANTLRKIVQEYMNKHGVRFYRMWFGQMKKTALGDNIKYYPSVAIVKNGKLKAWLDAGSDKDADAYNNYEDFSRWMGNLIIL